MFLRHLKNVLSRQDSSKTKVRGLEGVLCRLGKIHLYHEFAKIYRCWYSKNWDKCNNEFYLYLPEMG